LGLDAVVYLVGLMLAYRVLFPGQLALVVRLLPGGNPAARWLGRGSVAATRRMRILRGPAARWLAQNFGADSADTQTTEAERACLARHARGRREVVELGVMDGVTTALLRSVMAGNGTVTGIDPHPPGRLGVSFERLIARRQLRRYANGRAVLLRQTSYDAAAQWTRPIDFLFIDADHCWSAIERDWREWAGHVAVGGVIALHDSQTVPDRPDHDSVRFTREVVLEDDRFVVVDVVDSLTVLERCPVRMSTPS